MSEIETFLDQSNKEEKNNEMNDIEEMDFMNDIENVEKSKCFSNNSSFLQEF